MFAMNFWKFLFCQLFSGMLVIPTLGGISLQLNRFFAPLCFVQNDKLCSKKNLKLISTKKNGPKPVSNDIKMILISDLLKIDLRQFYIHGV